MEEWKEVKLGEVCLYNTEKIDLDLLDINNYISTENMQPNIGGITVSSNLPTSGNAIHFCNGDILISNIRPYFKKIWYANKEGGCSADVLCLRNNKNVDSLYLYYLLSQQVFFDYVMAGAKGCKMPRGDKQHIMNWQFAIPPLLTQQKIANILSSLDDKIEVNRRINENLEAQAQALFKSWFVDFEPFKDGEFVESELGMIPKGWRVYQLNELINIISGYSYKGNELIESDIAMVTIKNFDRNGGFKTDGYKEILPSSKLKVSQIVTLHDIVVAHTDLTQNADIIGNPAMIMSLGGYKQLIISMDLVKVKSVIKEISNGLLYSLLKDERFKNHALGYVNGTTVLHLSKKALPDYKLALPIDLDKLVKMSKLFDDIFFKEANNYSEIERLASLRDTLLPKLMSGEVDVNDIKI